MAWFTRALQTELGLGQPKPDPAMTTVAGETHRLIWVDRHVGYRMRCSCGWIDGENHRGERAAVKAGNDHVRTWPGALGKAGVWRKLWR